MVLAMSAVAVNVTFVVLNARQLSTDALASASPSVVIPLSTSVLGFLVASRLPRNPTGWLLLGIAVTSALNGVEEQYARLALVTRPGLPGAVWAEWLNSFDTIVIFPTGALLLLLLLLPNGRLLSRRWRPVVVLGLMETAFLLAGTALAPGPINISGYGVNYTVLTNPVGLGGPLGHLLGNTVAGNAIWFVGIAILLLASAAPLLRMRRGSAEERQQLKWIAYAVLVTVVSIAVFIFLAGSVLPRWTFDIPVTLGFGVAFPLAIGIAIFKHRLYDIDLVINRTLVYASLAVFITAVYVGIAVGIGAALGGGGRPNLALSIVATAVVAVGFQPVRERVQRVANRLVYGRRATPYEVLAQLSERVAESYATDEVIPRMARLLGEGTGAQAAAVWLRNGGVWRAAATWPEKPVADVAPVTGDLPSPQGARIVPVRHQGELLGALSVTKRPGESLTPIEESLLADLASQAGLVLKNVRLTSDLEARLRELQASRQRLVGAQDAERRRLERNLHDGAQQHLVALKVKLGLVTMLLGRDPERAQTTLRELKDDADTALETLRDLARGIYPPLLASSGLVAALSAQANRATVPVSVRGAVGRYAPDVEAAVYFSVLEALQNVQKYAGATSATVALDEATGRLCFCVRDDGRGFDVASTPRGSGLTNLADRLDALGGEVEVRSSLGRGTEVSGWVPVYEGAIAEDQASSRRSGLNSDLGMKPAAPTSAA